MEPCCAFAFVAGSGLLSEGFGCAFPPARLLRRRVLVVKVFCIHHMHVSVRVHAFTLYQGCVEEGSPLAVAAVQRRKGQRS